MPRTREELDQAAADAERWLDEMDPTELDDPAADSTSLRRIGFALDAVASSENELAEAVRLARDDGRSWNDIAAVLGISRQAAQKRYGRPRNRRQLRKSSSVKVPVPAVDEALHAASAGLRQAMQNLGPDLSSLRPVLDQMGRNVLFVDTNVFASLGPQLEALRGLGAALSGPVYDLSSAAMTVPKIKIAWFLSPEMADLYAEYDRYVDQIEQMPWFDESMDVADAAARYREERLASAAPQAEVAGSRGPTGASTVVETDEEEDVSAKVLRGPWRSGGVFVAAELNLEGATVNDLAEELISRLSSAASASEQAAVWVLRLLVEQLSGVAPASEDGQAVSR
jgi:hypothetical protein